MLSYGTVFELTSLLPGSVGSLVTAGLPALETFLHMFLGQNFIYMFLFIGKIFMWLFYWQDLHMLIRLVSIVRFSTIGEIFKHIGEMGFNCYIFTHLDTGIVIK